MSAEYDKLVATRRFLQRTQSVDQIKAIALQAFNDLQRGVKLTNVGSEGGSASGHIVCDPHILLNACEDVLVALGDTDAIAALTGQGVIFTSYNQSVMQT